jgi:hypothetical protein
VGSTVSMPSLSKVGQTEVHRQEESLNCQDIRVCFSIIDVIVKISILK